MSPIIGQQPGPHPRMTPLRTQLTIDDAESASQASSKSWTEWIAPLGVPLRLRGGWVGCDNACDCCNDPAEISRQRSRPLPYNHHWHQDPSKSVNRTGTLTADNDISRATSHRSAVLGLATAFADKKSLHEGGGGTGAMTPVSPSGEDQVGGATARPGTPV